MLVKEGDLWFMQVKGIGGQAIKVWLIDLAGSLRLTWNIWTSVGLQEIRLGFAPIRMWAVIDEDREGGGVRVVHFDKKGDLAMNRVVHLEDEGADLKIPAAVREEVVRAVHIQTCECRGRCAYRA